MRLSGLLSVIAALIIFAVPVAAVAMLAAPFRDVTEALHNQDIPGKGSAQTVSAPVQAQVGGLRPAR
jgi:hypothetical protein